MTVDADESGLGTAIGRKTIARRVANCRQVCHSFGRRRRCEFVWKSARTVNRWPLHPHLGGYPIDCHGCDQNHLAFVYLNFILHFVSCHP